MFERRDFQDAADRAAGFVEQYGRPIDRARVGATLRGERAPLRLLGRMAANQDDSGGWSACWSAPHASLEGSCHTLAQLTGLRSADSTREMMTATHRFLLQHQRSDGSWIEITPGVLPPWLADAVEARAYLTALCGSALIGANGAAVRRAADVLRRRVRTNGSLPGPIPTQWLAARVLATVGDDDLALCVLDPVVDMIEELDPAWLSWLAVAMPDSNAAGRARRLLLQRQRRDGGWTSELGTALDGEVAVTAIEAFLTVR